MIAGDTYVITRQNGPVQVADLVEKSCEILTNHSWAECLVLPGGVRPVKEYAFCPLAYDSRRNARSFNIGGDIRRTYKRVIASDNQLWYQYRTNQLIPSIDVGIRVDGWAKPEPGWGERFYQGYADGRQFAHADPDDSYKLPLAQAPGDYQEGFVSGWHKNTRLENIMIGSLETLGWAQHRLILAGTIPIFMALVFRGRKMEPLYQLYTTTMETMWELRLVEDKEETEVFSVTSQDVDTYVTSQGIILGVDK